MQKIELGIVALGSIAISLGVSFLYQNNFGTKESTLTEAITPNSDFDDLHERLSNLEQLDLTTDSTIDIIALKQTLASIQEQLTELQEQKPLIEGSVKDDESNEIDYYALQQQEELATRRKEHWDSQVYDSVQNVQYTDEINELFSSSNEGELINSECGAATCRMEIAFDHITTDANFIDKLDQLAWVEWSEITIKDGEALVYISADAAKMNLPSFE